MKVSTDLTRYLRTATYRGLGNRCSSSTVRSTQHHSWPKSHQSVVQRRHASNPADHSDFKSILDNPPQLVKVNQKHGWGILVLAAIPITAIGLGSWQIQRLGWKTKLIARYEDRLIRDPLPLPAGIDPSAIQDFDYRRVYATGRLRHDQEILMGPRVHDGKDGYNVITPLDRGKEASKILVNRGWIRRDKKEHRDRPDSLPAGDVMISGLLREPAKQNLFTPRNQPAKGQFYSPDVDEMADLTQSSPVWVESTMRPDLLLALEREEKGIPIGRPAEVNLRNNHTQYIFTWFGLAIATSVMFFMVVKKPRYGASARVRRNIEW